MRYRGGRSRYHFGEAARQRRASCPAPPWRRALWLSGTTRHNLALFNYPPCAGRLEEGEIVSIRDTEKLRDSNRMTTCASVACQRLFAVCRRCDGGRRYCGPECAKQARLMRQREASRVYQSTERGRLAHAARQARYRARSQGVTHRSPSEAAITGNLARSRTDRPAAGALRAGLQRPNEGGAEVAVVGPSLRPSTGAWTSLPRPPRCAFCGHDSIHLRSMSLVEALRPPARWPWRRP